MKRVIGLTFAVMVLTATAAQAQVLVNNDGGVCLDAEGGSVRAGARLIAFTCHGSANQQVKIDRGRIIVGGGNLCATAKSRSKGSEIVLASCDFSSNGNALQNFAWWGSGRIGHNTGFVLAAAGSHFSSNRPLCLWSDENRADQKWRLGNVIRYTSGMTFNSSTQAALVPGKQGLFRVSGGQLVGADGASIVAAGGGNIVAAGGLN
ncbi:MAG TPA: RICIN domain-containing protein [Thermoanaerobaculia bacterium]